MLLQEQTAIRQSSLRLRLIQRRLRLLSLPAITETKAARNKSIRSEVKTVTKKVEAAVAANDKEAAKAALTVAISTIESAASKGVYHKNNSARKVSRLTKLVNAMA